MRRVIIYILVSIICGACSQTAEEIDTTAQKIVFGVEVSAPEARTALVNENGKYKAIWKAGDTFSVVQIADSDSALYSGIVAEDAASIVVNAEFEQSAATKFTYIFASPAATVSADCSYLEMSLPEEQSPAAMNTFDSTSDLILSNAVERESQPNGENVPFIAERISAVGKMTVKNLPLAEGEQVTSVTFTTTQPLAGTISNIKVSDIVAGNDALLNATYLNPKGTITINLPEPQSGEFTLYFSCLPATLPAGSEYSVTVTSTNSTYTKQAQIPSNLSFTAGRMTSFAVNMEASTSESIPNYIYLVPNDAWKRYDAWFAAYFFNSAEAYNWVKMEDTDADGTYECLVPDGMESVIFVRLDSAKTEMSWDNKWNQTGNITLPTDDKKYFYITGWESGLWQEKDYTFPTTSENNQIIYFSSNEEVVTPYNTDAFGANIVSNIYENGQGVITFDGDVTKIGDNAFYNREYLISIVIPDSVTEIGSAAFAYSNNLVSVNIPEGVATIGDSAFSFCSLTSINIPDSVTSIGQNAFYSCNFTTVDIPDSLTSIGQNAFYNCNHLVSVYCKPIVPPTLGSNAFYSNASSRKIYVPSESVVTYRAANNWNRYATSIVAEFGSDVGVEMKYTTKDGQPLDPYTTEGFGATFVENRYDATTGQGTLVFDGQITTIPTDAFLACTNLTWIDIPLSVTIIGDNAFKSCSAMEQLTLPVNIYDIGTTAFDGCAGKITINCAVQSPRFDKSRFSEVVIGSGVTTIGSYSFQNCTTLQKVTISDSVTSIGGYAFSGCTALEAVAVPNSVQNIDEYAFSGCKALETADLGSGVVTIGSYAFRNCLTLISVVIPDSTTEVSRNAFEGCTSLKSATLGSSLQSISSYLFYGCSSLESISIPDSATSIGLYAFYNCSKLATATIGGRVTNIGEYAFQSCAALKTIDIPNSVTSIARYSFFECTALESVTIGSKVTVIGEQAFKRCYALQSVIIGSRVTEIGYQAFAECKALIDVAIPDSVITMGQSVFYACSALTSITLGSGITEITPEFCSNCTSLQSVDIPDNVQKINNGAFLYCTALQSVTLGSGVKSIGNNVFDGCANIKEVAIPDSTTTIGYRAFYNCSGLTTLTFGNELQSIGEQSFCSTGIVEVTIPDKVTTINTSAFSSCTLLERVTIGSGVTAINSSAFNGCSSLASVHCKPTTPPTLNNSNVFDNNATDRKIYVPTEAVEAYKTANYWSEYAIAVVAEETTDEEYANTIFESLSFVFVEGGTFTMGATSEEGDDAESNETPAHSVTVSDFYIGKYEVTQAQWRAVMGSNPSNFKDDNLPVECVSWDNIQEFITKLNIMTGKTFRLPTEAEWEYAARGGNQSKGYKYSGSDSIEDVAWYESDSGKTTHAVGQKQSNELGIYDMSGNVFEWCQDWFDIYSSNSQTNPTGPNSGSNRVLRGGSWTHAKEYCRVSLRSYNFPERGGIDCGFRLACNSK